MHRLLFLIVAAVSLCGLSCKWLSARTYNVNKTSPNGAYRVKFDVRVEKEGDLAGHFTEYGKIQYFKGEEELHARDWVWRDNWESTSIDNHPVFEWLGDNVLRMGRDKSGQPFLDEVIISNDTDGYLKYVDITYGKSESLVVFDVAPRTQIAVQISPEFLSDISWNTSVGYSGETRGGKKFQGVEGNAGRRVVADGPAKYRVTINSQDLR